MTATPPAGLCIAGTVPPGDTSMTRCTYSGGHDGPHSWDSPEVEAVSVESVAELLVEAADILSGLLDALHDLKRAGADEAQRLALLITADQTSHAWTYTRMALTTLTKDVKP